MHENERLRDSTWFFWALLSLPFFIPVIRILAFGARGGLFFYWTGVASIVLTILALAVTPFRRFFPAAALGRWLLRRRRYIGVAAFAYAALHTVYWLQQAKWGRIVGSFMDIDLVTGWISLAIMTAMAITSNDLSVRRLGPGWKSLQRWIYLGAPLGVLHYLLVWDFRLRLVVLYGGSLALVMALRLLVARRTAGGVRGPL
jgi:methionine sulfoxide reductase heme-binding subunit